MTVANDNAGPASQAYAAAYGRSEVVVIEAPNDKRSPYWRELRLPGAAIQYGFRTVRDAVIGEAAQTFPISGAAAL